MNRHWNLKQSCLPGYFDTIGPLDMLLVIHKDENSCVLCLTLSVYRARIVKRFMILEAFCPDWPTNRYYSTDDAESLSRKLKYELQHLSGPARLLLGRHNTEVTTISQRDRVSF